MRPMAHGSRKRDSFEILWPSHFREQCGMGGINEVEAAYLLILPTEVQWQVVE